MADKPIKVLLIEDNHGDARFIKEIVKEIQDASYDLEWCQRLAAGMKRLAQGNVDLILTDLMLPDSRGMDTLKRVLDQAHKFPVIVLTGIDDVNMAITAVREGAQDYLVKERLNSHLFNRAVQLAIERQKTQEKLRAMSLTDELTGLYNRRGFTRLAQRQLRLQKRVHRQFYLIFVDIDSMKWINDNFGHTEGDRAIINVSQVLKESFRESDIIARIGGDEFVVLATEAEVNRKIARLLFFRLRHNLEESNRRKRRPYKLSVSIGIIASNSGGVLTIDDMLRKADAQMYENKRKKAGFLVQEE